MKPRTIPGARFGALTVTRVLSAHKVEAQCVCGRIKEFWRSNLAVTSSCGCRPGQVRDEVCWLERAWR